MSDSQWNWSPTSWLDRINAEKAERSKAFKEQVVPVLKKKRLRRLVASYCGEGDSGGVESWSAVNQYGKNVPYHEWGLTGEQRDILECFALSLLPGGWEIDDGANGEVTIDLSAGKATVEHDARVTSTEHSTFHAEF